MDLMTKSGNASKRLEIVTIGTVSETDFQQTLISALAEQKRSDFYAGIMGRCFQNMRQKPSAYVSENGAHPGDSNDIQALAEHVVQFPLAGIRAFRSQTFN